MHSCMALAVWPHRQHIEDKSTITCLTQTIKDLAGEEEARPVVLIVRDLRPEGIVRDVCHRVEYVVGNVADPKPDCQLNI